MFGSLVTQKWLRHCISRSSSTSKVKVLRDTCSWLELSVAVCMNMASIRRPSSQNSASLKIIIIQVAHRVITKIVVERMAWMPIAARHQVCGVCLKHACSIVGMNVGMHPSSAVIRPLWRQRGPMGIAANDWMCGLVGIHALALDGVLLNTAPSWRKNNQMWRLSLQAATVHRNPESQNLP